VILRTRGLVVILFSTRSPHSLAAELIADGHTVYEALAVSEVFALVQEHPEAQIVITGDVDPKRAKAIQQRYPTITLKRFASETH
jgi:hypothetical protein